MASSIGRIHEEAADELARLDVISSVAPPAFAAALRLSAIADLDGLGAAAPTGPTTANGATTDKGTRALVAAFGSVPLEQSHPRLAAWQRFVEDEERRARGGLHLTRSTLGRAPTAHGGEVRAGATQAGGEVARAGETADLALVSALDAALRTSLPRASALDRALAVSSAIPDRAISEAAAGLILCAEGRTDRLRLLPFVMVPEPERAVAIIEWNDGNDAPWSMLALGALASSARVRREALERAVTGVPAEDELLDSLGRAAITARRALAVLRDDLAVTMPGLATALGLSRPAAGNALDRLAAIGLATEVSGRQRDRVFAYPAALSVAAAPRS
ncbi:MAG: hypothetical protein ACYC0B_00725 [Gemmatimonadaceae bacterium]